MTASAPDAPSIGGQPPPPPEFLLDRDRLTPVVRRATGRPDAVIATADAHPAPHRVENMTTAALTHVSGTLADGTPWQVFAKTLRPVWRAPQWDQVPAFARQEVRETLDWEDEPRVYTSDLHDDLPAGLRLPEVLAIDREDERITLWLEDVADVGAWDATRYRRTARRLGRLAGRWSEQRAVAELGVRRRPLAGLFHGKISHVDLPALAEDAVWATPALQAATARHGDLRGDLGRLAAAAPSLVTRYEELPHALAHGDATPDNFREPEHGDVVAIDLSYVGPAALGSDLGQLLVGRFESGAATERDLDAIGATLLPETGRPAPVHRPSPGRRSGMPRGRATARGPAMAHPSTSTNSYVAYGLVAGAALGTLLLALTGSATWLAAMAGVGLLVGVLVGGWRDHRSWREPPRGTADPRQDG